MKTKASYLKCLRFVLLPLMFHLSQAETLIPDLSLIESGNEWEIINRKVTVEHEGGQVVARFRAENDQPGIAWLKTIDFKNGTIEVDLRGENVVGKSYSWESPFIARMLKTTKLSISGPLTLGLNAIAMDAVFNM